MVEKLSPQEQFQARLNRVETSIRCQVPDRVPVIPYFSFFPARYAGITTEEAFYDPLKWVQACQKTFLDFEPDMYSVAPITPGYVLEALKCHQVLLPGHGVPATGTQQFVETDYMKANEYAPFLYDPSDYAIRTLLPRIYGKLEPFNKLPPLRWWMLGYSSASFTELLAQPDISSALEALLKAAKEMVKWNTVMGSFRLENAAMGFPAYIDARTQAPFDLIPDYLRGMRGSMLDMYRQPDKVLEACEKILPMMIELALSGARASGNPRIFIPLHRGAEGFMSLKQFETFYWPTFKRLILALVENGLTPCPFFEGDYTSRLEYLLELPKAKILGHFDTTDIFKAKQVLGGHMCIRGDVPPSILQTGSVADVKHYCQKLIDVVGKDGGFIMSSRTVMDDSRPENVKAMCDFTRQYGVYR